MSDLGEFPCLPLAGVQAEHLQSKFWGSTSQFKIPQKTFNLHFLEGIDNHDPNNSLKTSNQMLPLNLLPLDLRLTKTAASIEIQHKPKPLPKSLPKSLPSETASTSPTEDSMHDFLLKHLSTESLQRSKEIRNIRVSSLDPLIDALSTKMFSNENVAKMLTLPAYSQNETGNLPTVLEIIVNKVLLAFPQTMDNRTARNGAELEKKATAADRKKAEYKEILGEARRVKKLGGRIRKGA